jgi:hypothetical protein
VVVHVFLARVKKTVELALLTKQLTAPLFTVVVGRWHVEEKSFYTLLAYCYTNKDSKQPMSRAKNRYSC